ncbi:MAG: hypothetical protein M3457_11275 [Chloroflexota bacterium]|nr:hypothetical protein [Chloroflexota bacterium]
MNSTNSASARICPVCNAPNSNLSLFCAECGASMNAPESDDTAAYKPMPNGDDDDAQRTAAFEPGSFADTSQNATRVTTEPSTGGYGSMWQADNASPSPPAPVWSPAEVTFQTQQATPAPQGIRGFVLGLLAVLLMLAVFLLWTWATLLDQGTRDSIQDFFGFMG